MMDLALDGGCLKLSRYHLYFFVLTVPKAKMAFLTKNRTEEAKKSL